ncbi:hypothetical protein [Thalassotalea litorea]|uniref:hypothetical protein n=1 Tax=Thalassotalea litorea TaxID=2020715 RepID=UPI00373516D3
MVVEKTFTKYLANFAEPETQSLSSFPQALVFEHVVILPAYKESAQFCHRFDRLTTGNAGQLLIVVINQPDTDNNTEPQQRLFAQLHASAELIWQCDNLSLLKLVNAGYVLVVERFIQPIPYKQGVGLARKIAADLACYLIAHHGIQSPWICSTDADAHLPANYFSSLPTDSQNISALVFDFYHQRTDTKANDKTGIATDLYEQSMRYYVGGLNYAGSRYGYFTIGSILAISANAYVKARGFPKRAAGEDFYLLNKIAKLGEIKNVQDVQIKIDARVSDRVPFGTGPAVQKIIDLQQASRDYCYYQPQVFIELKQVLDLFKTSAGNLQQLLSGIEKLSVLSKQSLTDIGFTKFVNILQKQRSSDAQTARQLIVWFDAFKTLKFIHALRDNGLTDIPLQQALDNPYFASNR